MAYIGNPPTIGQWRKLDDISGSFNGSTTTFTTAVGGANVTAGSANQLIVSLGGVIQQPNVDYSVTTNSIIFTTAPASGLDFFAVLAGDALNAGTPGDGTVTTAKLAGNLTVDLDSGSAAAPSLTFDPDTGLYSPGADQVGISTGGTSRITVDASGNVVFDTSTLYVDAANNRVGVGTTSPGHNLEIKGSFPDFAISDSDTVNDKFRILHNSGATQIQVDPNNVSANSNLLVAIDGSERARIDSSGRLLVGTSTSRNVEVESRLQVEGDSVANASVSITRTNANPGYVQFGSGSSGNNVASGSGLGILTFAGYHTSAYYTGARIAAEVDGTPGANDMPGRLVFSTTADGASSPTERMRISNTGFSSLVSADNGLDSLSVQGAGTTYVLFQGRHSATVGSPGTGTVSYKVFTNGDVQNTNNSYGALSDIKLKENIVAATSQWNDIKALQVRKYNLKEGQTHTQIGLVAQEVELVSPGLVSESPDRDEDGNDLGTVTKSVNYSVLYMKAVKALQEAMERIEQLETEMAAVKAKLP